MLTRATKIQPTRTARRRRANAALAFAALTAFAAPVAPATPAAAQPADSIAGTWDLYWQRRSGAPRQSGYMVFRQAGSRLTAEMHGRGQVNVHGTVAGHEYHLRGSRMLVSYRIDGHWQGDRLDGAFSVMGRNLPFTGTRRR